jgi:hypothetical protein
VSRDEAVKAEAVEALAASICVGPDACQDCRILARKALTAVWPFIERAVRAQAAAEVRARRDLVTDRTDAGRNVKRGMSTAARIVEGSSKRISVETVDECPCGCHQVSPLHEAYCRLCEHNEDGAREIAP